MSEWIPVKKRLPTKKECAKDHGWFIVFNPQHVTIDISRYDGHEEEYAYEHGWKMAWDGGITHWMLLPGPPNE